MPRPKRFDYYVDEVDWSYGHGYRIRIPYADATGAKRIYQQTFSTRKLGLDMVAARDRLIQVLGAAPPKKKPRRRSKPKRGSPRKPFLRNLRHFHNYRHFGFALLLMCRSQNAVSNSVWRRTGQNILDKFEKLIRDAIALLIQRGGINISRKKSLPPRQTSKQKDGDPPDSSTGIT